MRIVHIIDNLTWGGAQKLLVTFAETAVPRGHQLTVISLGGRDGAPFAADLQSVGVRVHELPASRLADPRRFGRLLRLLRNGRFHVAHTHLAYANILGTAAARLAQLPSVATLHNVKQGQASSRVQRLEKWILNRSAQRVIAVGDGVAQARQADFQQRPLAVIPNAVPPIPTLAAASRAALRAQLVGDAQRPLLITVGSLTPQKGYIDLLQAFALVKNAHPDAALLIVGRGPMAGSLQRQAATLGLAGSVFMLGGRSDVPRLLAAGDLFVSASHWEGLPVAVLEAMAAGLPVVATAVGDVPQVVVAGTGVVLPPHAPPQLAAAMNRLLANPAQRRQLGQRARAHVLRAYHPDVWVDQLLTLYRETDHSRLLTIPEAP